MSENEMGLNDFIDMVMNSDLSEVDFKAGENENDFYDRFIALGRKNIKAYNNAPKTIVPNIPVFKRIQQFEKALNEYVQRTRELAENSLFGYDEKENGYTIKKDMIDPRELDIRITGESFGYWRDEKNKELVLKMIHLADSFSVGPGINDTVNVTFIFENAFIIQLQK